MLIGHGVRIAAFITAGSNFSHIVETGALVLPELCVYIKYCLANCLPAVACIFAERRAEHQLITSGVYGTLRHPAYFGFFWWSVGTQILLCNPLCTVAYAVASWKFFSERIRYEEAYLRQFFGASYAQYRDCTTVGVPLIS